jgi:hypothetical protein
VRASAGFASARRRVVAHEGGAAEHRAANGDELLNFISLVLPRRGLATGASSGMGWPAWRKCASVVNASVIRNSRIDETGAVREREVLSRC